MAAPPDTASIKTWEDAFQHPIPTVRALERQLQTELATNKEKLRGLVGESYRDLLRTAERIIDMDHAAQQVERNLADTSRACNSRVLERRAGNLRMFEERVGANGRGEIDREKYVFAAQLAVLQSCPPVVARMLAGDVGGVCLLATKVFVVSRLLLKSLQKCSVPLLESLKMQRAALNTLLTHHIDLLLSTPSLTSEHLVSVFTSFSLLKTSSPADVLRHFLFIRSTALSSLLEQPTTPTVLKAVSLFNQTLQTAEAVFPKRVSDALVVLKSRPLFMDPDLLAVAELGLDVNARWMPEEIAGFVPWVRHDDLERGRVVEVVKNWAERELAVLNGGFETALGGTDDIAEIVRARTDILNLWRSGRPGRRSFLAGGEKFRDTVGDRLGEVLRAKCAALQDVAVGIADILQTLTGENADSTSLWSRQLLDIELTNGGFDFKETVQSRVHGKSSAVRTFRAAYSTWLTDVSAAAVVVRELRNTKPAAGTAAEDDDDFDTEEEKLQEGLEDSEAAEKDLLAALDSEYRELERTVDALVDACGEDRDGVDQRASTLRATFLLRVIRQIRQHPPKRDEDVLLHINWFGLFLIPRLHGLVATGVGKRPFETVGKLLNRRKWSGRLASKALWEGSPSLPVQPSPLVFKFLHDLVTDMHSVGDDVWTPAAVRYVKVLACQELWRALEGVLSGREIGDATSPPESVSDVEEHGEGQGQGQKEEEGDDGNGDGESEIEVPRKMIGMDWAIQLLFDALYLDEALQRKGSNSRNSGISSLAGKMEATVGIRLGFDEDLRRRLEGSAREYWKRTCLLFGLLS